MKYAVIFWLAMLTLLAACSKEEPPYQPGFSSQPEGAAREYSFGVHPLHNPKRLLEVYGPLMDHLNARIPDAHFRLEASRNYEEYEKKLYARHFEFALPNPYQTINAMPHGYHVFGKMGDDANFSGVILVRRDSGIRSVADLKGKKISYPAKTALAATMMPQYFLLRHGLNVQREVENFYVGSQESSIMNVFLGDVAAAATWPIPWLAFQAEHPEMAAQLEARWVTEPLINNSLMARDDMQPELVQRVANELARLHETESGRALLARLPISRFEQADDARYDVVREFLKHYRVAFPEGGLP